LLGTTAAGNRSAGNLIGTNPGGAANLGNALDGLVLSAAPGNTMGGSTASAGNGIDVLNIVGTDGVVNLGNFIGTNPSGLGGLGNGMAGVLLSAVSGTVIAGAALPNLISGNGGNGIYLLGASAAGRDVEGGRRPGVHGAGAAVDGCVEEPDHRVVLILGQDELGGGEPPRTCATPRSRWNSC